MHIEYIFCFICSKQCINIISSRKSVACLVQYSKKIFLITPTFKEVGGVTQILIVCGRHKNLSWYRINHHKID